MIFNKNNPWSTPSGYLALAAVFLLALGAPAAAVTLDELMDTAMDKRALIKAHEAMFEKSGQEVFLVKGRFLPTIDLGYQYNSLDQADLSETERSFFQSRASATWNLFSGFKDINDLDSAKKQQEIRQLILKGVKQDIRLEVALDFLEVFGAVANLEVAEDALSLYRKEQHNVELKYKVGVLKKNDWLKIKVEAANALQQVHKARALQEQAVNNLGLKTVTRVKATQLDFGCFNHIPVLDDPARYQTLLMENRSEIQALRCRVEDFKISVNSAKAQFYPKLDLVSQYLTRDDGPGTSNSGEESRIMLRGTINLFDGFRKNRELGKARLDVVKVRADLTELEREMTNRLDNLFLDFNVSLKNMDVADKSRTEAQENLRITRLAFEKGILTSTDLLDAIYYLSRARFKLVDSRITMFRNHFRILRMVETL
ncbi:TolC family protein [Desulfobacter postgatei]|jgi:outer membrane protein TolC|uniref:TolC family protein n=1 Tax=Desulfobacter postgatei TaxID=2293 RepID=UPI002A35FFD8|nr:TolC family protein [Desulfobacter postgatei]MDX9963671.1 TolC family protein [Desulfobacter postgatei]